MVRKLSVLALGVLCSLGPVSCIKTRVSEDDTVVAPQGQLEHPDNEVEEAAPQAPPSDPNRLLEANCGRLTVRGGLKSGELVKITANGWIKEEDDFVINVITDETPEIAKLRAKEAQAVGASAQAAKQEEQAPKSVLGIRIIGNHAEEPAEGEEAEPKKGVELLVYNGEEEPQKVFLNSEAGPTKPFMVILQQVSKTEMKVTITTWISDMTKKTSEGGYYSSVSKEVGTGLVDSDLAINVNNPDPKFLKMYGSETAELLTVAEGKCDEPKQQLIPLVRESAPASPLAPAPNPEAPEAAPAAPKAKKQAAPPAEEEESAPEEEPAAEESPAAEAPVAVPDSEEEPAAESPKDSEA